MKPDPRFVFHLGDAPGWKDKTVLEVLEQLASDGEPEALEFLRQVHCIRVSKNQVALIEQARTLITRIKVQHELDIHPGG